MAKEFSYEIIPDFDFIIEEGQNNSTNLRKISWNGREPKLDIRKWAYNDGTDEKEVDSETTLATKRGPITVIIKKVKAIN